MDFKDLGELIAKTRKKQNVSQSTLSQNIGISRATLSSFENGKGVDIGLKKVLQVLEYLNLSLDIKEKSLFPTFEELKDEQ